MVRIAFVPWGAPYQSEYFLAGIARAYRSLKTKFRKELPDFEGVLDWPSEIPKDLVRVSFCLLLLFYTDLLFV